MMIVDGPKKTAFALEQALAARELAGSIPSPHAQRLAARGVFVAVVSFIGLARQTRKAAPRCKATAALFADLKRALNDLADRDWGPYSPLRDRIGAHRQPIGGTDDVNSWEATNKLWAHIDAPLIGVLCDDMVCIQEDLRELTGGPEVVASALPASARESIAGHSHFRPPNGLRIATGSFGETIPDSITPIVATAIGERLRQISDTIDGFECYAALNDAVPTLLGFMRTIMAGAIIETANLVELIFEVPANRALADRYAPLVDLIPAQYAEAAELRAAKQQLDPDDLAWIRDLRNTVAAHIDARAPLPILTARLDGVDAGRLTDLFHQVGGHLVRIDNGHSITVVSSLVRLRDKTMTDVRRVDAPAFKETYDA